MQKIHFIGIGGIGTSALARIYHEKGMQVTGSDMENWSLIDDLKEIGIKISIGHKEENLPEDCELVVYSEAIPETNVELQKAREKGIKCSTYFEELGEFSKNYKTIAIAGAHGKTTVTGMIAKMLIDCGFDPTVVIGSKMKELGDKNCRMGKSEWFIVEACEYRRSFLHLHPNIIIVTNIEYEHPDYYKDFEDYNNAFEQFKKLLPEDGKIISNSPEVEFTLTIPGEHNRKNAGNVMELAKYLQIPEENAKKSLQEFSGTWRRFEMKKKIGDTIVISDYGHHPTEIKATLSSVKEKWPNSKVLCVFQPHQYARTHELIEDFAKSFNDAAEVIIPDIYKVRDSAEDIAKVSAESLVEAINKYSNNARFGHGLEKTKQEIQEKASNYDIIIVMGAGNVWTIVD